jgi:hypothetical protein
LSPKSSIFKSKNLMIKTWNPWIQTTVISVLKLDRVGWRGGNTRGAREMEGYMHDPQKQTDEPNATRVPSVGKPWYINNLWQPRNWSSIPGRGKRFIFLLSTASRPASLLSNGYRGLRDKAAGAWSWPLSSV